MLEQVYRSGMLCSAFYIPSSSTKNTQNIRQPGAITTPVTTQPLDPDKRISHFFMTVNGITIVCKKLPNPILDSSGNSVDLHIPLPQQMQTTLARNEIVISPDGTSGEEAYLKNMISLTIDRAIDGSIGNQQIIYALYQGLEQWEQQSVNTYTRTFFKFFYKMN